MIKYGLGIEHEISMYINQIDILGKDINESLDAKNYNPVSVRFNSDQTHMYVRAFDDALRQINNNKLNDTNDLTSEMVKILMELRQNHPENDYATIYKNINISSAFTVKLADFGKSSMTMILSDAKKPFRFYNHSGLASKYYVFTSFKPKVNTGLGGEYYIIDNIAMSTLYSEIRHMGIPFYATFDTYTFIISLLLVPEVFRSVFSNPMLQSVIWDPLWFPGDSDKVYRSIVRSIQHNEEHTMGNVIKILKNIKLRCNITANIISLLAGK